MALNVVAASPLNRLAVFPDEGGPADAELVARALAGDAWADGAIYRRHARRLSNLAARLLGSRAEAEDVLHDVFVDVLQDLTSLRDPSALEAWLKQRTVRRVQRRFRRRTFWRFFGRETTEDLSLALLASAACPPDLKAELTQLESAIAALPSRQRIAWVLHVVDGESLPDAAAACGVSLATIKRDIAAAQRALETAQEVR
ncbi:MAG: RNA polymerase sigma factor [Myxococcaceae bacterium]|nr:RNA polymerase sigma factor [Myxococcaceae bacterium]